MQDTLFILEEPYVSDFLLETLEKNSYNVLLNDVSKVFAKKYNINFSDKKNYSKVYSNSENSIEWVLKNCKNDSLKAHINKSKDKYEMRKSLKDIYPNFFFKEVLLSDIENLDSQQLPESFIIKPTIGFLSMGVHKVNSHNDLEKMICTLKNEITTFKLNFPETVLNSSKFIIEEVIKGEEFAVDVYFDDKGLPVILNIFAHPFISEDDVSDRVYITSKKIINDNINEFEKILGKIAQKLDFKNFPAHVEVIKKSNGEIIPVEINPMRFAGWCTTDLMYYAYGINPYEYFAQNKKPDWKSILQNKDNKIYYFAMAETPTDIDKNKISFDYDALEKCFSKILDIRKIDFVNKPVFAVIFGETTEREEINKILQLNMKDFISEIYA